MSKTFDLPNCIQRLSYIFPSILQILARTTKPYSISYTFSPATCEQLETPSSRIRIVFISGKNKQLIIGCDK